MTNDSRKTKAELLAELETLRARIASCENHARQTRCSPDEDVFRQMVDGLPQIIFELDLNGRFTYTNDFALATFGWSVQDFHDGMTIERIIHPDDLEKVQASISRALRGAGTAGTEYIALRKDGTTFPINVYSKGLFKNGKPIGIRGVVFDISDMKQAEKALRERENYYRTLFDNTGTAMVTFGKDSVIRSCNSQFEALAGYTANEIEHTLKWSDFVDLDHLQRLHTFHTIRNENSRPAPNDYEFVFIARGGVRKFVHVFVQIIPDTEVRVCSLIDITTRKKTEQALRESQERYELVVRGANDGIWDWDLDTNLVYYSPRYKAILGYADDELPNRLESWKNNVHPDDIEYAIAANKECIDGSVSQFEVEYRMRHKDGTYRWIMGRGTGVKDETGKVFRLGGTHTDITERKLHERTTHAMYTISKAISTTHDLQDLYTAIHSILSQVVDATNFFIALIDEKEDRLVFSYFADEKDDYYDIRNISDPKTRGLTLHVIRTGKPLFISQVADIDSEMQKIIGVVGTPAAVWLGVPLKVQDTIIGAMAVQHYSNPHHYTDADVNLMEAVSEQVALAIERKSYEEELNRLNEHLESKVEQRTAQLKEKASELEAANIRLTELDRIKSSLVSSISHELRTPLTSVRGFAKLTGKDFVRYFQPLADDAKVMAKGERIRTNLKIIETEGERLTRLINDFLDINRIESGKAVWNDRFLNPCEIIQQATDTLIGAFAAKECVDLVTDLPNSVPTVHADPDKLQQVIINLLNNACKFTNEGWVKVSLSHTRDSVTVSVADSGMGISPDELEHVFEKFHKGAGSDTVTNKDKGTGLGLAICKEIVEHYEGSIWVESQIGKGSVFSFTLPAVPGTETS